MGKKSEAGAWEVYLQRGDQVFIVRKGDVVEKAWRVDEAAPPNLVMTYLPLGQARSLSIGEAP